MQWMAMDGWRMDCDAMDGCGFVNFMFFGWCFMLDVN
jgi:hypothetical protein